MTLPLQFQFVGTYTGPPALPLAMQFADLTQTTSPYGLDAGAIGAAVVATVQVAGIANFAAGTATIQGPEQEITGPLVPATFIVMAPRVLRGLRGVLSGAYAAPPDLPLYAWFGTAFYGVTGAGAGAGSIGVAGIRLDARSVLPEGIASFDAGAATAWGDQRAMPAGLVPDAPPLPTVTTGRRTIAPSGAAPEGAGDLAITHWRQRIEAVGPGAESVGGATASTSPEVIEIRPGMFAFRGGTARVGRNLDVNAGGDDLSAIGSPEVLDNRQVARPDSIANQAPPVPSIAYWELRIIPPGWPHEVPNGLEVIPMLRYVRQVDGVDHTAHGFGVASIANVDVTILPDPVWPGPVADRLDVARAGILVRPDSALGTVTGGAITHAVRSVVPSGAEPGYITTLHQARNDAQAVDATAVEAERVGAHGVASNLQAIGVHSPPAGAFGEQWVSRGVRTVVVLEGAGGSIPVPTLELWERYIGAAGLAGTIGMHDALHAQNVIEPDPMPVQTAAGLPRIANWNPEVTSASAGEHQYRIGQSLTWHWERTIGAGGVAATLFGVLIAGDSTRTVRAQSAAPPPVPTNALIYLQDAGAPATQAVQPQSVSDQVNGSHSVRGNALRPTGDVWAMFGTPTVTRNRIVPAGLPPPGYGTGGQVGFPALPGTQVASPESLDAGGIGDIQLDPRYIYGPVGGGDGEMIDTYLHGENPERPVFGRAAVSSTIRAILAAPTVAVGISSHSIELLERYIQVDGGSQFRRGVPDLGGGWIAEPIGADHASIGHADVAFPPMIVDHKVYPSAFMPQPPSPPIIEHQHRTVNVGAIEGLPTGAHSIAHQFPPFELDGWRSDTHGATWVARGIRTVSATGWDSADLYPIPQYIALRMRVRQWSYLRTAGAGQQTAAGRPSVELSNRTISPRAAYLQAPVPEPRARGECAVTVDGVSTQVVGAASMWRPGDPLQPYGADLLAMGETRAQRAIVVSGVAGEIGAVGVGRPLYVDGGVHSDVGSAVVSHAGGHVCGRAPRAISVNGVAGQIGAAEIGHA